jgi:hypothetical protein
VLGRDELERDAVLRERAQGEHRFECGDAAACDDDS